MHPQRFRCSRTSRWLTAPLLATALALGACVGAPHPEPAKAPASSSSTDPSRAEVESAMQRYAGLILKMDYAAIAAQFVPDGRLTAKGHPIAQGREAILQHLQSFAGFRVDAEEMTSESVAITGTAARQTGRYRQTVQLPDGGSIEVHGAYTADWARQADGSWLLAQLDTVPDP